MTDELRKVAETLKVAADKLSDIFAVVVMPETDDLSEPETDCPSGWHIARVAPGREEAVEPYAVKTRHGDVVLVNLPADKDDEYGLTGDWDYVWDGNVEVICSLDDAVDAWLDKEKSDG